MDGYDDTVNYCGPAGRFYTVPRWIYGADVNPACFYHDSDYSAGVDRATADRRFLDCMLAIIRGRYGAADPRRYLATCRAWTYYGAVRAIGWKFHKRPTTVPDSGG